MKKNKKHVRARHRFYFAFLRPVGKMIARKYHFKTKVYKLKKGEQYLILSNHQGVMDPILLTMSFNRPIYFVANEFLFNSKLYSKLLTHCFAPIKKKKGVVDIGCIKTMCHVAKEGGNVAIFPEGNRAWCDFQFFIDKSVCKLIRILKLPVILYNFHGGYGVNPRWADNVRKGSYTGEVKRILSLDEINAMDDDTLHKVVLENLRVIDSESGKLFTSDANAEYLERELFVCPKCHSVSTLRSHKHTISCEKCGLEVSYNDDLTLSSPDSQFPFNKLVEWYKFQLQFVKDHPIESGEVIFSDQNVVAYDVSQGKRVEVAKGQLVLTDKELKIGQLVVPTDEIINSSVTGSRKFNLNTTTKSYFLIGDERFNVIKYLFVFNRICKNISDKGGDKYYGLSIPDADC